jgi:hypothetical protein
MPGDASVAEIEPTKDNCITFARRRGKGSLGASVTPHEVMSRYYPSPGAPWSRSSVSIRIYAIPVEKEA